MKRLDFSAHTDHRHLKAAAVIGFPALLQWNAALASGKSPDMEIHTDVQGENHRQQRVAEDEREEEGKHSERTDGEGQMRVR